MICTDRSFSNNTAVLLHWRREVHPDLKGPGDQEHHRGRQWQLRLQGGGGRGWAIWWETNFCGSLQWVTLSSLWKKHASYFFLRRGAGENVGAFFCCWWKDAQVVVQSSREHKLPSIVSTECHFIAFALLWACSTHSTCSPARCHWWPRRSGGHRRSRDILDLLCHGKTAPTVWVLQGKSFHWPELVVGWYCWYCYVIRML